MSLSAYPLAWKTKEREEEAIFTVSSLSSPLLRRIRGREKGRNERRRGMLSRSYLATKIGFHRVDVSEVKSDARQILFFSQHHIFTTQILYIYFRRTFDFKFNITHFTFLPVNLVFHFCCRDRTSFDEARSAASAVAAQKLLKYRDFPD